eukprot:TRINITY_DN9203_c0_g1_i1.p1 TRINITY_DN9203_c0_g1~~TRINITY_DN9203_c0_g1_i1.p1  ORF type:complete len:593 (+),score=86.69 TRINITY_DN9203_c0_g1_i1:1782-3560(+)
MRLRSARPESSSSYNQEWRPHIENIRQWRSSLPKSSADWNCLLCQNAVALLQPLLDANFTDDKIIIPIATRVCEVIERKLPCEGKAACKLLCEDVVPVFLRDIIAIALKSNLSPEELCYVVELCPKPPPVGPPIPVNERVIIPSNLSDLSGQKTWDSWSLTTGTGTFLHLSDIHLDIKYQVGALTDCGLPMCCRAEYGMGTNKSNKAGFWGDYNCDPPMALVNSMFDYLINLQPQPDFILYTGDDPAHDIWEQSREANLNIITIISEMFLQYFPNIPVFSAIGNHESFPVNQYEGFPGDSWLYDAVADLWAPYLPDDAIPTLRFGGYYAALVRPGLVVASLNTNVFCSADFWLYDNNTDFTHQFAWLRNVLDQAASLGDKVIIIGHAPTQSWSDTYSWPFNALVSEYSDVIIDQFYGHHHISSVQVHFNNESLSTSSPQAVSTAYVVGSVTTFTQLNPGFRVYSYNREITNETFPLALDFDQYWADLVQTNKDNATDWGIHYSALAEYNLPDLTPNSWAQLGLAIQTNQTLYERYMNSYYRGVVQSDPENNIELSCEILSATNSIYSKCASGSPPAFDGRVIDTKRRPNNHC